MNSSIIKTCNNEYLEATLYTPKLLKVAELANKSTAKNLVPLLQRFVGCRVVNTAKHRFSGIRPIETIESIKPSKLWGIDIKFVGHEFIYYGCLSDLKIVNNLTNYHTKERV